MSEDERYITIKQTNRRMPRIGLGTADMKSPSEMIYEAIKKGYRHIDTAAWYKNESEIGDGIARAIADGLVTRDELFVTSKLWSRYHEKEHVEQACRLSLKDLKLDYLDLYLIHWPVSVNYVPFEDQYPPQPTIDTRSKGKIIRVPLHETWSVMEQLVDKGLARHIGVSNFEIQLLQDLESYARIPPVVNQVESHPNLPQQALLRYCTTQNIVLTCYCPLGRELQGDESKQPETKALLKDIASRYNKSPAHVCLRWALQRSAMTAVIPRTSNIDRLAPNLNVFDFKLTDDEVQAITSTGCSERCRIIESFVTDVEHGKKNDYPVFSS